MFIFKPNASLSQTMHKFILIITIISIVMIGIPQSPVIAQNLTTENEVVNSSALLANPNAEWTQEGHDAQRTGFTAEEPADPWQQIWTWNGPDANGGTGGHRYNAPAEAHTVTGGNYVYVPAGSDGLYALGKQNGSPAWHLTASAFNATPAYDPASGSVFAGGADGKLYKIDSNTGNVQATYNAGGPINKAVLLNADSVYVLPDNGNFQKVNTGSMSRIWTYAAGANASTPAAFSENFGLLIFASSDLYIHAVRDADGGAQWRVKPTSHEAQSPFTFSGFWPVIAEQHGIVFVRLNLGSDALWSGTSTNGAYPATNTEIRSLLQANNGALENLFALNLQDGSKKFIPAVGYGGTELRTSNDANGLFLESGPVPVVKVNSDGSEVAYIPFRSVQGNAPDGRWDSHMGEMVLDGSTIPGLAAGDMRFVDFPNSYVHISDEQTPFTMAGNTLFHAHWGASESARILDRSAGKGLTATSPITAQSRPTIIRRIQSCTNDFNPTTHKTNCNLILFADGRSWSSPGFWVYWNVMDPPTPQGQSYSDGLRPRYTYVSSGLIVVEGNGGELSVFSYGNSTPPPAATATSAPKATATRTSAPPAVTSTPTRISPTATRAATNAPTQQMPTPTRLPATSVAPTTVPPTSVPPTSAPTAIPNNNPSQQTLDTFEDFSQSCAVATNTHVSEMNGGSLTLAATLADHFASSTFNTTYWSKASLNGTTYTPTISGSVITLPSNGYIISKTKYTRGIMEATAQFDGAANQMIGFGNVIGGSQYFGFTSAAGTGKLYAQLQSNSSNQTVDLGALPQGMHNYQVVWSALDAANDRIDFYIDGNAVAGMQVSNVGLSSWNLYLANGGTGRLSIHQAQVAPSYVTSGTYYSCKLDAGVGTTWQGITWDASLATSTGLSLKTRTSTNGTTWTAWVAATGGKATIAPARFVQVTVSMSTTNTKNSPVLKSITINKTGGAQPTAAPTQAPQPTATRVITLAPQPTATRVITQAPQPTATRQATQAPTQAPQPTATRQATQAPTQAPQPTATRQATQAPTQAPQPTATRAASPTALPAGDRISNVAVISANPAVYDKFEVQFNVNTAASSPDMPFDPNPPTGVQSGIGVSVNGLFSADNWKTTLTQPAFLYQPYTQSVSDGKDRMIPTGSPRWVVRFAPQLAGTWQYRLSMQDAQGQSVYPPTSQNALTVNVAAKSNNTYTSKGFIGVSATDARYFSYKDGSPFVGVGFNDGFNNAASTTVEQKLTSYEQNKMNFMRVWMAGSGINGSQWSAWATHFLGDDGYMPGTSFDITNTYNGSPVSMRLDNANPCLYADFWRGGVPAEPSTKYQVWARIKVSGVSGPSAGGDYGFVIKQGGWLDKSCANSGTGTRITAPVNGSGDWVTVTGTYTTGAGDAWLGNLYLARENATGGQVYIDEVRIYRANDPAQVNLLRQPNANAVEHFDMMTATQWDNYIQSAEKHGVYIKLVIDEKNEWIRNHMGPDGKMSSTSTNDNFYAAPGTKVRWLEQAWWRYIIARWGYSTAIHSFEYVNEGDPYSQRHYEATEAMAKYFHQNDPSHHMVTTSLWHSFPNAELWSNPQYSDIDYTDIHAYISTGWGLDASFLPAAMRETSAANVHSGGTSARMPGNTSGATTIVPRGLVIKGQGEWIIKYWMKASGLTANCPYGTTGSMMRVRWMLDGGNYNKGKEGVVPANSEMKDYVCTSPNGTFDWKQFSSVNDRDGTALPTTARIIVADNLPHELSLLIENGGGTGGTAWIDDVQIINPAGKIQPVIGTFETTPMDEDTAWYNQAYGEVFGGGSLVGARKPLVRGETGIDFVGNQTMNTDTLKDTKGIWLHNNVWGQMNSGGMYDLFWWSTESIPPSIYSNFLTYQNFMQNIPLSNGRYQDSRATTSNASLRVLGQRDDTGGQMHLWVQNTQHTWKRVVNGPSIPTLTGTITLPNVATGSYKVEWWNTYNVSNPVFLTQTLSSNGSLVLTLPNALADDVAVKITKVN